MNESELDDTVIRTVESHTLLNMGVLGPRVR